MIDIHVSRKERYYSSLPKSKYTQADALLMEKEIRKNLNKTVKHDKITVFSVAEDYLKWVELHQSKATYKIKNYLLRTHILPFFGNFPPEKINENILNSYKAFRKSEATTYPSIRQINLEILCLRHLVKKMFKEKLECELLPDKRKLPIVLTKEEVRAFIDALEPKYRLFFLLLYQCGLRKFEALNLKWEDIDIDGKTIIVKGKGDKWRQIPLSNVVLQEIVLLKKENGVQNAVGALFDFVNPYKAIQRAKKKAGIEKRIYPHLLRHCFGTHMVEGHIDLMTVQELMGHQDLTTTKMYTHLSSEHKRKALEEGIGW